MWVLLHFPGGLGLAVVYWSVLLAPVGSIAVSILVWRSDHPFKVLAIALFGAVTSALVATGFATSELPWSLPLLTRLPEWLQLGTVVLVLMITVEVLHEVGEYEAVTVSPVRFLDGVRNHWYRMVRLAILVGFSQFPSLLLAGVIVGT